MLDVTARYRGLVRAVVMRDAAPIGPMAPARALAAALSAGPVSFLRLGEAPAAWMMLSAFLQIADVDLESERPGYLDSPVLVRREPVGVVAAIVPQFMTLSKFAPALLAGCTLVINPARGAAGCLSGRGDPGGSRRASGAGKSGVRSGSFHCHRGSGGRSGARRVAIPPRPSIRIVPALTQPDRDFGPLDGSHPERRFRPGASS